MLKEQALNRPCNLQYRCRERRFMIYASPEAAAGRAGRGFRAALFTKAMIGTIAAPPAMLVKLKKRFDLRNPFRARRR